MTRVRTLLALAVLGASMTACGGEPEEQPLSDGVTFHVDQSRVERKGREVFLRVGNETAADLTITRLELASPRFPTIEWTGDEVVTAGYETDLEVMMPPARCGDDLDVIATLTYREGDGDEVVSTAPAEDVYGAVSLLVDRDCAELTLAEAADLTLGEPVVEGSGDEAVLRLPVTLTPTGDGPPVSFGGYESTPLFTQARDSPVDVDVPLDDVGEPVQVDMLIVPARCDPHALAEDKVGTLFGVQVVTAALPADTSFYLPVDADRRVAMIGYFRARCGLD